MKVFLSTDIEGTAGIVDWGQVLGSGEYEMGRRLLQSEVNAAIDGARSKRGPPSWSSTTATGRCRTCCRPSCTAARR